MFEEGGPEAYGKFVYFEAENFACRIVAELVHGYHCKQYEHRQRNRTDRRQRGRHR